MSRILTLDPMERENVKSKLQTRGARELDSWRVWKINKQERGVGAKLIAELKRLKLSREDELRVIVGPGNFTGIRVASLVGNTLHFLNGVKLSARTAQEKKWRRVELLQPFYAEPPEIGHRAQVSGHRK